MEDQEKGSEEEVILPEFTPGEHGIHEPQLMEKMTQPPKFYTEATLLRAMETAGRNVEDEELRDLLKENGIGRPSTRANIIETLFRRRYIRRDKKKILANPMGVELIETIENDLLKSAELTGQWEKKLRQIEAGELPMTEIMTDLKQMVNDIVIQVKNSPRKIINIPELNSAETLKTEPDKITREKKQSGEIPCPKCKTGKMIHGNHSWGCSAYKTGCDFRLPFEFQGKKLGDSAIQDLCTKSKTGKLKGFKINDESVSGMLFLENNQLKLEPEKAAELICPKCKKGFILKGKTSWGCSGFREGCQLRIPFEFKGKLLKEAQMQQLILKGKTSKLIGFIDNGTKKDGQLFFNSIWEIQLKS
jgi:DNA topoisomerase-3